MERLTSLFLLIFFSIQCCGQLFDQYETVNQNPEDLKVQMQQMQKDFMNNPSAIVIREDNISDFPGRAKTLRFIRRLNEGTLYTISVKLF